MMGGEGGYRPDIAEGREVVSFAKIEAALLGVLESQREFLRRQGEVDLPEITIDRQGFSELDPDAQVQVQKNVQLLQKLTGHQGAMARNTALQYQHGLSSLLSWAQDVARTGHARLGEIARPQDRLCTEVKNGQDLHERIMFSSRYEDVTAENYQDEVRAATYRVLRMEPEGEWGPAAAAVLRANPDNLGRLIETLGFIPSELFENKVLSTMSPREFARAEQQLRRIERSVPELADQARAERTKLTSALFLSGTARKLRLGGKKTRYVTLDSNGVQIHFDGRQKARKGRKSPKPLLDRPFVAHIPYGLVSDKLRDELSAHWLGSESEGLELELRRAQENFDTSEQHAKREHQYAAFADMFGLSKEVPEATQANVAQELLKFPDRLAKRVVEKGEVIPDALIDQMLAQEGERGAHALTRFAEGVAMAITGERISNKRFFIEHGIQDAQERSYRSRAAILSDARYYNAKKIVRRLLSAGIASDASNQFLLFRGEYKKSAQGRQHSFIESVHEGAVARILIDETKDLKPDQHDVIPVFEREAYLELEESLRAFDHFIGQIERMQKLLKYKNKNWDKKIIALADEAMVFVLTNQTGFYRELLDDYTGVKEELDEDAAERFVAGLERVKDDHTKFLYGAATSPGLEGFKDMFRPSVRMHEVEYGEDYLALAKEMCPDWGYDEELSLTSYGARVVALDYKIKHPSETIPVDIEETVLEKLRVNRDRPLINVVGGCRFEGGMDDPEKHPLNIMSAAVMRVAHDARANVAVPGSQSGIGVFFGRQQNKYQAETAHLPFRDRAHLFSVSTGGNTVYPDNPLMADTDPNERYAMPSIDTVVTPITALYGESGEERVRDYAMHIVYMESLFARISQEQPRVLVAGSGGVFSIMEINESIKHGFDIVLLSDSGRFSEAACVLLDNLERLPDHDSPDFDEHVFHLLEGALDDEVFAEYAVKDFGGSVVPSGKKVEDYVVHRKYFREFARLARENRGQIHATKLTELESKLSAFMT